LNKTTAPRWLLYGLVQATLTLIPFAIFSDQWTTNGPSVPQSMAFGVLAVSTVFMATALRRGITPGWYGPYTPYFVWMLVPLVLTVLAIELPLFNRMIDTMSLSGGQWLLIVALALVLPIVIEIDKGIRRARGAVHSA